MSQSKYDQVIAAYRQLIEAGESITQDKIKAIIFAQTGIKMSNSTVSKHLQQLRASNPDEFLKGAQSDSNEPIPGEHQALMQMVYHSIRRATELTHSTATTEKLEAELEILTEKLADGEAKKAELSGLRFAYETQLKRSEELIRENQGLRAGIAPESMPVVDELNAQVNAIASSRDQLAASVDQLTQQAFELNNNIAILTNRCESLEQERQTLQQRNQELAIANGQIEPLQAQLAEAKKTIEALQKQLGDRHTHEQMGILGGEVTYLSPVLWELVSKEVEMIRQPLLDEIEQLKSRPARRKKTA